MSCNRRKQTNELPLASMIRWIVVSFFAMGIGVSYAYLNYQHHATGDRIKKLEGELNALIAKNEVARANVSSLGSRSALQRRLNEGFIKMKPIADNRIVRIDGKSAQNAASEFQPVANTEIAR